MPPDEAVGIYHGLMQEVKLRTNTIQLLSNGEKIPVPAQIAYESCYLQLRLVCETIALACLVIHGDLPVAKGRVKEFYQADKITSALEKAHLDFFPEPVKFVVEKGKINGIKDVKEGFLTRTELASLWRKSGNILHRGNRIGLSPVFKDNPDFRDIVESVNKITVLLAQHRVRLFGSLDQIWCVMHFPPDGRVEVVKAICKGKANQAES